MCGRGRRSKMMVKKRNIDAKGLRKKCCVRVMEKIITASCLI